MTERAILMKGARAALAAHVNAEPKRETGGILIGYRVDDRTVCITEVSPPGPRALMRRRFFRRDTRFLQRWLDRRHAVSGGRDDYLGEWHVHHAIDAPPSCVDKRELWRIAKRKNYPTDAPVLLIVEDTPEERRLCFYVFTLKPKRWRPIDVESA